MVVTTGRHIRAESVLQICRQVEKLTPLLKALLLLFKKEVSNFKVAKPSLKVCMAGKMTETERAAELFFLSPAVDFQCLA